MMIKRFLRTLVVLFVMLLMPLMVSAPAYAAMDCVCDVEYTDGTTETKPGVHTSIIADENGCFCEGAAGDGIFRVLGIAIGADVSACDGFVATVMRNTGADPNFGCCEIHGVVKPYLEAAVRSGKYRKIDTSKEKIQAGDIEMYSSYSGGKWHGHIRFYVVKNGVGMTADASYRYHPPELKAYVPSSKYTVYRLTTADKK